MACFLSLFDDRVSGVPWQSGSGILGKGAARYFGGTKNVALASRSLPFQIRFQERSVAWFRLSLG